MTTAAEPPVSPVSPRRADRRALAVVVLLALAAFAPVLGHDFLSWDDTTYLVANPALRSPTLANLAAIWRDPDPGLYVPVPYTAWWAIARVAAVDDGTGHSTLNPYLFHAANWLLHATAAGLTFALLRRLRFGTAAAFCGAAAFALHPLAVETVAWAMGLRDLLATTLTLATLLLFLGGRRWPAAGLMLLAVLSKPTAVMAWPAAVLLAAVAGAGAAGGGRVDFGRRILASWPLGVVALVGLFLTRVSAQGIHPDLSAVWQRPFVAADALAFYLAKLAWPWPLAFDYARTPAWVFASGRAWWTWVLPAAGLAGLAWARSRTAWLAAGLFVLPLVPVLGLVPFGFESLSTVADHYAYPALAGVAVAVAAVVRRWPRAVAPVGIVLAAWAGVSVVQQRAWADDVTFFPAMAAASPRSGPAWDGVARTRLAAGDAAGADAAAKRGIAVAPDYAFLRLTAVRIKTALHDPAGRTEQLDALERLSKKQSNFDPAVFAKVRAVLER